MRLLARPNSNTLSNSNTLVVIEVIYLLLASSSHSTTDRWGGGFYSDEDSWGVTEQGRVWADRPHSGDDAWGMSEDSEKSLEQAYKLGRYQLEYCFVLYNHTGSGFDTTFLTWDGSTQLVYAVTWWVNLPSKWCRKLSYLIDKGHYRLIIDHFIQIPVLIIEGIFGTVYNLFGAVVGLFLHPVDTFCALIGGIVLVLQGIVGAIVDLVLNIINVVGVMF